MSREELSDDELEVIHAALDFYQWNQSFPVDDPYIPIIERLLIRFSAISTDVA